MYTEGKTSRLRKVHPRILRTHVDSACMIADYSTAPVWSVIGSYGVVHRGCDVMSGVGAHQGACSAGWAHVFWLCISSMDGSTWHAARGFFLSGCCCVCAAGCGAGLLYLLGAPGFVVRASALGMGCAGVCWCGFASCRVLCVLLCYCVLLLTCASVVPAPRCRLSTATFVS